MNNRNDLVSKVQSLIDTGLTAKEACEKAGTTYSAYYAQKTSGKTPKKRQATLYRKANQIAASINSPTLSLSFGDLGVIGFDLTHFRGNAVEFAQVVSRFTLNAMS